MSGFDVAKAYAALRRMHMSSRVGGNGWLDGLDDYLALGYIPCDSKIFDRTRTASLTVDDSYTDWALAQLAERLGHAADYAMFMRRSENWKNLWDGHYIRPRYRDGRWADFKPLFGTNKGYCESNAEQYSFFMVHDVPGIAKLMGGFDQFAARLDADFQKAEPDAFSYVGPTEGTINYANEPNMQAAHLFNYAGKPWLSQHWARKVRQLAYGGVDADGGYAKGDEDQGQLGASSAPAGHRAVLPARRLREPADLRDHHAHLRHGRDQPRSEVFSRKAVRHQDLQQLAGEPLHPVGEAQRAAAGELLDFPSAGCRGRDAGTVARAEAEHRLGRRNPALPGTDPVSCQISFRRH